MEFHPTNMGRSDLRAVSGSVTRSGSMVSELTPRIHKERKRFQLEGPLRLAILVNVVQPGCNRSFLK
jgi:hypothetical protein